jgi:hypothetical protein
MTSLKNWLDRLLGRDKESVDHAATEMREPMAPERSSDVEDAATAARDEGVDREPMPPPGTG